MSPAPAEEPAAKLIVSAASGAVIAICDWEMNAVKQGIGPLEASVPSGLYVVTASFPGRPHVRHVVQLKAGQTVSVALAAGEAQERRAEGRLSTAVSGLSENLALLFGNSRKILATLDLPRTTAKASESDTPPLAVWVRFATLKTWERAATLQGVSVATGLTDGVPFLTVRAVKESPLILQVGYPGAPVTNVLLPSRLMHVSNVRVLLPGAGGSLKPTVELKADWGDLAAQFAMAGNVHAAKQALEAEIGKGQDAGYAFLSRLALRFSNLAAIAYVPYLVLRLATVERLNALPPSITKIRRQMTDLLGFLPDAHVVAAELAARLGKHKEALQPSAASSVRTPADLHGRLFDSDLATAFVCRSVAEQRPEEIDDGAAAKAVGAVE